MIEVEVECPFCGESQTVLIDPSEEKQSYIEDCAVCCRPIQLHILLQEDNIPLVEALRD